MDRFDPSRFESFEFVGWTLEREAARLTLHYRLNPGLAFAEVIEFEAAELLPGDAEIGRCARLLHLLAGISYYKTACPSRLIVRYPADPALLAFVRTVYFHGLGEFAHVNGLDLSSRINLNVEAAESVPAGLDAEAPALSPGMVVPIGGGKDSLVTADLLAQAGLPYRSIAVGTAPLIEQVVAVLNQRHIRVRRTLDPTLFACNRAGALNGHVPISAILAAVMTCAGAWYGFDTIVMSNERSAEVGNLISARGDAVNHQFSKTLTFESAFANVLAREVPGMRYFSLLRPHSELAISRYFARLEAFHGVFSSCNTNFRLTGPDDRRWCRDCPKCRFVFLALAPFLDRERLLEIFGGDLLDDSVQESGFAALLGVRDHKPFECVGEIGECRAAFTVISERAAWRDAAVVVALRDCVPHEPMERWLAPGNDHALSPAMLEVSLACARV